MEKTSVPAVSRAFAVLEYLAHSRAPRSLKDIYTELKLPKTSVFSLMNTLVALGVARRTDSNAYIPGIRLYSLGVGARLALEENRFSLKRLEALRDEVGLTVYMTVFDNGEYIVWEKVEGSDPVWFKAYPGERRKLNTSSAGKAIAAYLSPPELELALSLGLDKGTEKTITTNEEFIEHLRTVRENGYAVDDEEWEKGIFCLGVPVFSAGRVYGSISLSTLKSRIQFADIPRYIAALKRASADISTE